MFMLFYQYLSGERRQVSGHLTSNTFLELIVRFANLRHSSVTDRHIGPISGPSSINKYEAGGSMRCNRANNILIYRCNSYRYIHAYKLAYNMYNTHRIRDVVPALVQCWATVAASLFVGWGRGRGVQCRWPYFLMINYQIQVLCAQQWQINPMSSLLILGLYLLAPSQLISRLQWKISCELEPFPL